MKRNIIIGLTVVLAGCTTAEITAVEAAVAKNSAAVQAFCTSKVIPVANSPEVKAAMLVADLLPYGSDFTLAVNAGVATCNNIDATGLSATTVAYLTQELPVIAGLGKVAPPPAIAPAPITAASVAVN